MSQTLRILIVEDSEDDAKLAMRMLRQGGFDPIYRRVHDPASLQASLAQERWDAVLSDYRLPGFSGVQALELFRAAGLDIPFLFFSGNLGEEAAVAAMKAGANDYVMKDNMARLAPALRRELEQARIRAEHRLGQIELEASRDRYVDLYDFAPVGYLTLSTDGLITQLNLTGADMLGESREQLLHTAFARFVLPADVDRWHIHFAQTLHHGNTRRLELELQNHPGNRLHLLIDCRRGSADMASPTLRVTMTDITGRKAAEAELRRVESQLRDMQKMESIGTLAGGIAHDFNNILGAILGNIALAREDVGAGHPALASLEEIYKASVRARSLVQQILTFSRREPQELVTQPLWPVVEETCKLLRATVPARVEIDAALPEQSLHVLADATQVQQVLMNLCTNAWHALNDGPGRIGLGLGAVTLDHSAAQRVGALRPGPYVHLWVSDSGMGMDAAVRARIFEPFFTTKPVGQGTGLGLSVAHGIMSAHQGAITVDSQPGRGSTFHLYFPLVDAKPAAATAVVPVNPGVGHGEHVLYVDDDETMVVVVERILARAGFRVSGFHDAQEAVAAVRQDPDRFDFVVTDFNMPEFSGLDMVRELAAIRPQLPVVISSGYITEQLRDEAKRLGARGLLQKENTFQELSGLVAQVLSHSTKTTP